jgi:peroxiredoxin
MKYLLIIILFLNGTIMAQDTTYHKAKEREGLKVGEKVENFSAQNMDGDTITLNSLLEKGPLVIVFYRGHWCPICNKHLKELESNLEKVYKKGAQLIAVSPENSEFLRKTADKTKASFTLLYDEDYKISDQFGLTFRPDSMTRVMYNTVLGGNLKEAHSDDSQRLPIPATYIIAKDRKIVWRHFDPDYKKRAKVEDIINNIPTENE